VARTITKHARSAIVFSQGDPADTVLYLQQGSVKLSVLSRTGKEAVVAILGPGDFFGEGCLAGQPRRMATATALRASVALVVEKPQMLEMLQTQPTLADRFLSHMLARNIRIEEDLIDQLFNSSEKRLARALLLLARYGREDQPLRLPKMSQEMLAEMVGTTRSRINFFMNKFRKLGFIEYNGDIKVNRSLMTVVLHD
jgi:CRP-like cAMP-binding protein